MDIVGAFACSHSGLFISRRDEAPVAQRTVIYDAFADMGRRIRALAPDAVVLIATDHGRIYPFATVPQFTIGVSETAEGIGDAALPPCVVPAHQRFAQAILNGAIEAGVDIAFSETMRIDHSFVTPLMLAFGDDFPAIVPIAVNCNVPPLPTLQRSYDVGRVLGAAIRSGPAGRVVVVGTGGLSHWVGTQEQQLFMQRAPGTRAALGKQPLTLDDTGPVNAEFDRMFMNTLCSGDARTFLREWNPARLYDEAGNGAQEIRTWLLTAGVVEDRPGEILAYEPVAEWLTGTGLIQFAV